MRLQIFYTVFITVFICSALNASATNKNKDEFSNYSSLRNTCPPYDPYESINRKVYFFNGVLDTFILRPITKGYIRFTNDYTKDRVSSFVSNLDTPLSTVQYTLQGNTEGVLKTFWRFVINSTVGIAGLFDVASKFGLTADSQTFGNTLAYYGVGPGPYIVLPIYGPTNGRGVTDSLVTNSALNPIKYVLHEDFKLTTTVIGVINERSKIMPFTDYVVATSPDTYIAIRDAFWNSKESKMIYPENYKCPSVK